MLKQERRTSYQTGIELENTKMVTQHSNGSIDEKDDSDNHERSNDRKSLIDNATFEVIDELVIDTNLNLRYGIMGRCNKKMTIVFTSVLLLLMLMLMIGISSNHKKTQDKLSSEYCMNDPISALESTSSISKIKNGAVATDEKICSELSVTILQKGNAVDAAVTAALCLGVVNPASSGMGGGSFILVHVNNNTEVIDAREEAVSKATEGMFEGNPKLSLDGGLAIAIPGELKGLELAHQRHGVLPWKNVVTPVIALAHDGFPVSANLANEIQGVKDKIMQFPNLAKMLSRNNDGVNLLQQGDTLYQPTLAKTLQLVADHGAKVLYEDLAHDLVNEINDAGGIFTIDDFKNYEPIIREPLIKDVHGFTIVGIPPPSSGGAVIIGAARFLLNYKDSLSSFQHTLSKHRYVEALKHTFALRMLMADPAFDNITQQNVIHDLVESDYMDYLRNITKDDGILSLDEYSGSKWS